VTFGRAIPLADFDPASRRDLVTLAHRVHHEIGHLYKVLPTAIVASAMRPQIDRTELEGRVDERLALLTAEGANLAVRTARRVVDEGLDLLSERGVLVSEGRRVRVRDRIVLRYYARTLQHLLEPRRTTH
jgi:hypothetical protein